MKFAAKGKQRATTAFRLLKRATEILAFLASQARAHAKRCIEERQRHDGSAAGSYVNECRLFSSGIGLVAAYVIPPLC